MLAAEALFFPFLNISAITAATIHFKSLELVANVFVKLEALRAKDGILLCHAFITSVG